MTETVVTAFLMLIGELPATLNVLTKLRHI